MTTLQSITYLKSQGWCITKHHSKKGIYLVSYELSRSLPKEMDGKKIQLLAKCRKATQQQ